MLYKSLVIGNGEVGGSLFNVLRTCHNTKIKDKEDLEGRFDILHICFPYFKGFKREVAKYKELYNPKYTIIHSTVPIGTSRYCKAYHSPVRGIHPQLEKGLKTFVKYLAPSNRRLKEYFEKAGIKIKMLRKPETTEALKIWSTTQYGILIMLEKEIFGFCQKNNLDFNKIYIDANRTYNEGYKELGREEVVRPILRHIDGRISGHCIMQNLEFLDHWLIKLLKKRNETY